MKTDVKKNFKLIDMIFIAMFAALMAVCAWISIPATVPFTLQTFGVFVAVLLLGGKRGTLSVLVYILLGFVGVPVFAGFTGGPGKLLGATGGYIVGFLFSALVMWGLEILFNKLFEKKSKVTKAVFMFVSMIIGLIVCYAFGTAWFMVVYARTKEAVSLVTCLGWCVFPYIPFDLAKIVVAYILTLSLKRYIPE